MERISCMTWEYERGAIPVGFLAIKQTNKYVNNNNNFVFSHKIKQKQFKKTDPNRCRH